MLPVLYGIVAVFVEKSNYPVVWADFLETVVKDPGRQDIFPVLHYCSSRSKNCVYHTSNAQHKSPNSLCK